MNEIGRLLIVTGIVLLGVGLLLVGASRFGIGRLPGDFVFRRGNLTCIVPVATSILLSLLLTLIFWLLNRSR